MRTSVRALDNILDVSVFPTDDFKTNTLKIRPLGLGFTGLAELLFNLKIAYNSTEAYEFASNIAREMTQTAIETSIELSEEKGPFSLTQG